MLLQVERLTMHCRHWCEHDRDLLTENPRLAINLYVYLTEHEKKNGD